MAYPVIAKTATVFDVTVSAYETAQIETLLQSATFSDVVRDAFVNSVNRVEPEVKTSEDDFAVMTYLTHDSVECGIISISAGREMKTWDIPVLNSGHFTTQTYELISFDGGNAVAIRIKSNLGNWSLGVIPIILVIGFFVGLAVKN
ncbi:MAG: hypothetical protein WCT08_02090 [Patescibacteria group bacterium]